MNYELNEKKILKNQMKNKKKPENKCQNAACEHKKPLRNENLIQTKN